MREPLPGDQPRADPVDLDLHVTTVRGEGEMVLKYRLSSPSGVVELRPASVHGAALRDPDVYRDRLHRQLENLRKKTGLGGEAIDPDQIPRELATLGEFLFEELFPAPLRKAWSKLRGVRSLRITSDEPWIPWELVKAPGEDCFCLRFCLSRWLPDTEPIEGIRITRMAVIEAAGQSLPRAAGETSELQFLGRELGLEVDILQEATLEPVKDLLLQGGRQLFHFISHGQDTDAPDDAQLLLTDGLPLRSIHLVGELADRLRQDHPLVVFNACQVGRVGWSLAGLGGFAQRWIHRCGSTAFLGPQWTIDDTGASELVRHFYHGLCDGRPVADALCAARRHLRQKAPNDLTWLAYSLYAHPNAQIVFGDRTPFAGQDRTATPKTQIIALVSQSPGTASKSAPMRFTSHQARFVANPEMHYFLNISNLGAGPLEITHVWYEDAVGRIPVKRDSRPLPKRLEASEAWCSWIPCSHLPAEWRPNAYDRFRLRLSTGEILASVKEDSIPSRGSVPGGEILASDIESNASAKKGRRSSTSSIQND
jgi:hypothetical protein